MGKATVSGFERTGTLNRPPNVLMTALTKLKAQHILGVMKFTDHMAELHKKFPRTRANFKHLGINRDNLFEAEYSHINPTVENCEACDHSCLVQRNDRHMDEPRVHYGTIASGNQVIKHALIRDRLGSEHKALCFEMEAAGLMNNFPCIVVRGISDYSDSHKNKEWQPFAALTAAAYTKELLSFVIPSQVADTRKASQILTSSQSTMG